MQASINRLLTLANVQMAAEALLDRADNQATSAALLNGNLHASRFPESLASSFPIEWEVLAHQANTSTGFSGTLFRHKDTNEYVMSFRSMEFIDDAARDSRRA